jgi:methylated-DNA-[protein]-cysteine S-methyltransferase
MSQVYFTHIDSPIGQLLLTLEGDCLTNVCMNQQKRKVEIDPAWRNDHARFRTIEKQFDEYFCGARKTFDIPLLPRGTDFQLSVWKELQQIPYGTTISYGELARRIANPKAVRAVGLANGQNRLPIVIPCHRVIGANGSLTGFGGGIENKSILLNLEQGVMVGGNIPTRCVSQGRTSQPAA